MNPEALKQNVKFGVDGVADPVYQAPANFWRNPCPTEGLNVLLKELMGRLTASKHTKSPFIQLETSYSDGKTYYLIVFAIVLTGAMR